MDKSLYIVGSLRNPKVPITAKRYREAGWDVFEDWFAAGETADDSWQAYEKDRGRDFKSALKGYAAQHVYRYDKSHLDRCAMGLLVLPAGKSGHLELGYLIGCGKPGFILLDGEPERFDVMYNFAAAVYTNIDEALLGMDKFVGLPKRN